MTISVYLPWALVREIDRKVRANPASLRNRSHLVEAACKRFMEAPRAGG